MNTQKTKIKQGVRGEQQSSPFVVDLREHFEKKQQISKRAIARELFYDFFEPKIKPDKIEQEKKAELIKKPSRLFIKFKDFSNSVHRLFAINIPGLFKKQGFLEKNFSPRMRINFFSSNSLLLRLFSKLKRKKTFVKKVEDKISSLSKVNFFHRNKTIEQLTEAVSSLTEPRYTAPKFQLKSWSLFVVALLTLALPFKGFSYFKSLDDLRVRIIKTSSVAIEELRQAGKSAGDMDFNQASADFNQASGSFFVAKQELNQISDILLAMAKMLPNDQAKLAGSSKYILEAGQSASQIGSSLSLAVDGLLNGKNNGLIFALDQFEENGNKALEKALVLNEQIAKIEVDDLPNEYRDQFTKLGEKGAFFSGTLSEVLSLVGNLRLMLGEERDTRYLLVFQNNAEMRASGGFFGSYALIDFSRGKVKKLEIPAGGTYDVEAGYKERIIAPSPLHLVNPLWHLWDANWWYDWPTTAKKLMWFYEKSGGPTVDGVISITPSVIEKILKATGPIDMTKDYGVVITAENFWEVTQRFSEQKQHITTKPKRIIGDLMNMLISELPKRLDKNLLFNLLSSTEEGLNQKHILFNFKNEKLQNTVARYGWDGRVKATSYDYLAVINTNIAGAKSDRKIKQTINHKATVLADGSVIDELEIIRTHTGARSDEFVGARNVNWLRVYVPAGSELIDASGFTSPDESLFEKPEKTWKKDDDLKNEEENFQLDQSSGTKIYQEFNKTVFANWSMVDAGQTARLYLKYRLPFKISKEVKVEILSQLTAALGIKPKIVLPYGLLVQKQPGLDSVNFNSVFNAEPFNRSIPSEIVWQYSQSPNFVTDKNGWQVKDDLKEDRYWAIFLEQK